AAQEKQNLKLPELANQQQDLAKRTDALKNQPLPQNEAQTALGKAAQEMKNAAQKLESKNTPDAVVPQNEAIKSLEEARKELAQQLADIEKRRDDIAKLEDAAQKLADLAKQEGKIADQATELAKQPEAQAAKQLGQKQHNLVPPTKDVGKT